MSNTVCPICYKVRLLGRCSWSIIKHCRACCSRSGISKSPKRPWEIAGWKKIERKNPARGRGCLTPGV